MPALSSGGLVRSPVLLATIHPVPLKPITVPTTVSAASPVEDPPPNMSPPELNALDPDSTSEPSEDFPGFIPAYIRPLRSSREPWRGPDIGEGAWTVIAGLRDLVAEGFVLEIFSTSKGELDGYQGLIGPVSSVLRGFYGFTVKPLGSSADQVALTLFIPIRFALVKRRAACERLISFRRLPAKILEKPSSGMLSSILLSPTVELEDLSPVRDERAENHIRASLIREFLKSPAAGLLRVAFRTGKMCTAGSPLVTSLFTLLEKQPLGEGISFFN